MNIAVTGGNGFIGKRLVQHLLASDHHVRILTRRITQGLSAGSAQYLVGDLHAKVDNLLEFLNGVDMLYHCAAEISDPSRMNKVNVDGTAQLIEAASGRPMRWVQLSSVGAYGPVAEGIVSEDSPEAPSNLYEQTKTTADRLVLEAAQSGAFDAVLLRPSIVYGEGMRNQSLFQLFSMIERGLFAYIGPKGASANYVHVDDVVEALYLCGAHPKAPGQVYNLSDWDTMEAVVESVAHALGRPPPSLRLPLMPTRLVASRLGGIRGFPLSLSRVGALSNRSRYPIDKIAEELDFSLRVPIRQGFAALAKSWKAQIR